MHFPKFLRLFFKRGGIDSTDFVWARQKTEKLKKLQKLQKLQKLHKLQKLQKLQ